jgi:ribosomal protein L32
MPDGIEAGVILARDQLVRPFLDGTPVTASDGFETAAPELPSFVPYALLLAAVAATVVLLFLRKVRLQKTCPSCGDRTLSRTFEVIEPPTRQSEGSGIEHRLCESCGYTDRQVYELTPGSVGGYRRKLER